jgi:sugar phosphate isomerase/epimerase
MTRRTWLAGATGAAAAWPAFSGQPTKVGIVATSFSSERFRNALELLDYCHDLGAAGIQCSLGSPDFHKRLRARLDETGMYLEVMADLPKTDDTSGFEGTVLAAKLAGALCVRVACLNGRRYETFARQGDWWKFADDSRAAIGRALPIAEKHRLPIAIENHKDWTLDDMSALLKAKCSEFLGVCLDTGNNIALLDDPMAVVESLAPYAISTHFKDIAVEPHADGFLLSEVPLGEGILDLKRMAAVLAKARPATRLSVEMITRNPLKVPCLTDAYWATFPERSGVYLARTLALVRKAADRLEPLPRVDGLSKAARYRLEEDNIKQCLHYARVKLEL